MPSVLCKNNNISVDFKSKLFKQDFAIPHNSVLFMGHIWQRLDETQIWLNGSSCLADFMLQSMAIEEAGCVLYCIQAV